MTAAAWWVLFFAICTTPSSDDDACELGTVTARSCEAGEAWMRAGLREHQQLHLMGCEQQREPGA